MPIGHDHPWAGLTPATAQACAREAGLLDHYDRVQRGEARLRQAQRWR